MTDNINTPRDPRKPMVGDLWERSNGTSFVIHHIDLKHAWYWLPVGSKPQYRSIRLENLKPPRYRRYITKREVIHAAD